MKERRERERERERLTMVEVLLRETDEKESGFRGIASKIVRKHPRRDECDSGLKIGYGRREIVRNKRYEELGVISI